MFYGKKTHGMTLHALQNGLIKDLTLFQMGWVETTPAEIFLKLLKIGAGPKPALTFHQIKLSCAHFLSFLGCFHATGEIFDSAEFFCWRQHSLLSSNYYYFLTTYPFLMNYPSLECYCNALYEFLCFSKESHDLFAEVISFSVISGSYKIGGISCSDDKWINSYHKLSFS